MEESKQSERLYITEKQKTVYLWVQLPNGKKAKFSLQTQWYDDGESGCGWGVQINRREPKTGTYYAVAFTTYVLGIRRQIIHSAGLDRDDPFFVLRLPPEVEAWGKRPAAVG